MTCLQPRRVQNRQNLGKLDALKLDLPHAHDGNAELADRLDRDLVLLLRVLRRLAGLRDVCVDLVDDVLAARDLPALCAALDPRGAVDHRPEVVHAVRDQVRLAQRCAAVYAHAHRQPARDEVAALVDDRLPVLAFEDLQRPRLVQQLDLHREAPPHRGQGSWERAHERVAFRLHLVPSAEPQLPAQERIVQAHRRRHSGVDLPEMCRVADVSEHQRDMADGGRDLVCEELDVAIVHIVRLRPAVVQDRLRRRGVEQIRHPDDHDHGAAVGAIADRKVPQFLRGEHRVPRDIAHDVDRRLVGDVVPEPAVRDDDELVHIRQVVREYIRASINRREEVVVPKRPRYLDFAVDLPNG